MKVSYIIVWADTNTANKMDPKSHPKVNEEVNQALLKMTLFLIDQILQLNPHEILIMDNEGNFPEHDNPLVRVILSYQSYNFKDENFKRPSWLDKINISDYRGDIGMNHAKCCAMAYNHGIIESRGDYLVLQHNDTKYLFDNYSSDTVIKDAIDLLESEKYEYISVDKKSPKSQEYEKYEYLADCYWFLCRGDFYSKHNIWVDWTRGDNNHLATITCFDKGLKYLHLPGYFENLEHCKYGRMDFKWERHYQDCNRYHFNAQYGYGTIDGNLHTLNDRPFLIHLKGGTGLYTILKGKL